MKKLITSAILIAISTLCFANTDSSNNNDITKVKLKNDMSRINASFEVDYNGTTKTLAPNKTITIYNAKNNSPKACNKNKSGTLNCKIDLYYEGDKNSVSFEENKKLYKISEIVESD